MTTRPAERQSPERAKPIGRIPQQYREEGRALVDAIERAGSSREAVAQAWGVDDERVSAVCRGDRPLSWTRVQRLPPAVRLALLTPEIARASADTLQIANDLLLVAAVADAETAPLLATAMADGAITRSETGPIRAAALKEIAERQAVLRRLDGVDESGADGIRMGGAQR